MKINWWNVAAVALLVNAFIGMLMAIVLETGFIYWALANMVAFGIVRLEWFIAALNAAKTDPEEDPYE